MAEIAGDAKSAEWTSSRPATRGKLKAAWLADAVARADKKRKALTAEDAENAEKGLGKTKVGSRRRTVVKAASAIAAKLKNSRSSATSAVKALPGAIAKPMPARIHPMLATAIDEPFDNPDWLFEIKWDGYRAVAFIENDDVRLVSRNQNNLTAQFPELSDLPKSVKAKTSVLDGEIVALDDEGRPSFSLMQQRTGFQPGKRRLPRREGVPVVYYAFDLLYLDGYDLRKVALEKRKELLHSVLESGVLVRFSDHYPEKGRDLFAAAGQRGLEGILAKKRDSTYQEERSRDWLKIKITQRQECVIGGYTDPEGSRQYFGSVVLGLYDQRGRLIHVGQAGSGFDQKTLNQIYERLKPLATKVNPFYGEIGGLKKVHFVRPELVAEIKFSEWTHETAEGGMKLRAPVFLGLRFDKDPKECKLDEV
jgi:bifunctional non-homologous end joining protein LigD